MKHPPRIGRRVGRLLIVDVSDRSNPRKPRYRCLCDCGNYTEGSWKSLQAGQKKSCGCLRAEIRGDCHGIGTVRTQNGEGAGKHPLFETWRGMMRRCYDEKFHNYPSYGGRGVAVCPTWQQDFFNFAKDVGDQPAADYSLDRIDPEGDYCPENIRWVDPGLQGGNKRSSKRLTINGKTCSLYEWLRTLDMNDQYSAVEHLARYMPLKYAVATALFHKKGAGQDSLQEGGKWLKIFSTKNYPL